MHEGQGEGKDGDGRTPLITSASSNKHLPMSRAQTKAPFGFSANRSTYLGRRKMQSLATTTSCFSICIRSPLVPCTFSVNSHGPIILFTAVVDRGRQAHSSEVLRREATAGAMQTHSGAEHAQGPGTACA